ncbi:MAG TPA: DUF2071 domain-containing protein [Ignavibacteria bacterium]|nr:DUF2071 domain-containing protein [Ignavibacteria bacterium]
MQKKFLTAAWKNLLIANYIVPPELLKKYLPAKTELDLYQNNCFVSLVGFMFLNTKVLGLSFPFHKNFDEFNLRFYVKYNDNGEIKRGVTFIKEIVPKGIITFVANSLYRENYITLPIKNSLTKSNNEINIEYSWSIKNKINFVRATADNNPQPLKENSFEEFITEHFWGYSKWSNTETLEYQVEHPRWSIYNVNSFESELNIESLYGKSFLHFLNLKPHSVFLADGSDIIVRKGKLI